MTSQFCQSINFVFGTPISVITECFHDTSVDVLVERSDKMTCLNILTLFSLFALLPSKIAATKLLCDDAVTRSRHGFVLKGHVFESFTTERVAFCYSACNTNPACQSLNYNLGNKSCEFNSESSRGKPHSFQENVLYVYADNPDRG